MKKIIYAVILFGMFLPFSLFSQNIVQAEYYWDNDPGPGSATVLVIPTPFADVADFNSSISTSALSAGLHTLYVRVKGSTNDWSLAEGRLVYVSSPGAQNTIVAAEYFWDADPGEGLGNSLAVPLPFADQADFNANISTAGLSTGLHYLYIREKDNTNYWGIPEGRMIYVSQPGVTAVINAAEYFFDNDPGEGNGIGLAVPVPNMDLIIEDFTFATGGLLPGLHTVYFRSKDNSGNWGIPYGTSFAVQQTDPVNNLIAAEYFIDNDPGEGNGIALTVPVPNTDIITENFTFATGSLSAGLHTVYFRSKDANGLWGIPFGKLFSVQIPDIYPTIAAAEYFWDTDPGEGSGTAVTGTFNVTDSMELNASVSTNTLNPGTHYLFFRTKDSNGNWGMPAKTEVQVVMPDFSIQANTQSVCPGDQIQYQVVTNSTNSGLTYDWYYEPTHIWQLVQSGTSTTLNYPACEGFIFCIMHIPATSPVTMSESVSSGGVGVYPYTHYFASPGPSDVDISYPSVTLTTSQWPYCPNDSLIIHCNHSCPNLNATYSWSVDFVPVNSTDSVLRLPPHYINGVRSSTHIRVEITYTSSCGKHYTAANYLNVLVSDHPLMAVNNNGCLADGETTQEFNVAILGQGSNYAYEWKVNNVIMQSGPVPNFTATGLSGGESVSCTISGTSACTNNSFTLQSGTTVLLCPPTVSISAPADVDFGTQVVYIANATNAATQPTYTWQEVDSWGNVIAVLQSDQRNTLEVTACERYVQCIVTVGSDSRWPLGTTANSNILQSQYINSPGSENSAILIHPPVLSIQGNSSVCPNTWAQLTGVINSLVPIQDGNVIWTWYADGGIYQWEYGGTQNNMMIWVGTQDVVIHLEAFVTDECGFQELIQMDQIIYANGIPELHLSADQDLSTCPQGNVSFTANLSISSSDAIYTWTYNSQILQTGSASTLNLVALNPGDLIVVSVQGTSDCNGVPFTTFDYVFDDCNPVALFDIYFYIQGYYLGNGVMTSVLKNCVPGYSIGYICDSVNVELHQITPPFSTVLSFTTVFSTFGFCRVEVPRAYAFGSYYVVLKTRNSLETWSSIPVSPQSGIYYFNSPASAYGNNLCDLGDGNYAVWSGDLSNSSQQSKNDGFINEQDLLKMETVSQSFNSGYLREDITGDGVVESADYSMLENNLRWSLHVVRP